jgi:hypothetical protein
MMQWRVMQQTDETLHYHSVPQCHGGSKKCRSLINKTVPSNSSRHVSNPKQHHGVSWAPQTS